jgi:glycolate oxidase
MLDQSVIDALRAIAGEARVLTSQVSLTYSYDATADVPRRIPNVVVMPVNAAEVQGIVNLARSRGIAIYPRGAGTNLSGGDIPLGRGIVLSFHKDEPHRGALKVEW